MGRPQDEAHLKLPMDAVIWSLVRESPSIVLASVGKASFCLISTTKSHDVLRTGNASKKFDTKHNKPNQLQSGNENINVPTAVFPQRNSQVADLGFSVAFLSSWQRRKEQDPNTKYVTGGKRDIHKPRKVIDLLSQLKLNYAGGESA